jgi:phytoene dehydrogenase-like protein
VSQTLPARTADVLVVGAGHNSLTAAAYLARAGLDVLVLERDEHIGESTKTEESTLPGIQHQGLLELPVQVRAPVTGWPGSRATEAILVDLGLDVETFFSGFAAQGDPRGFVCRVVTTFADPRSGVGEGSRSAATNYAHKQRSL